MQRNDSKVICVYHFFSEAIIAFLLIIPFMYYVYDWMPYGRYLALTVTACCLLFIPSRRLNVLLRIGIVTPLLVGLFLAYEFPIGLSILFPIIFIWRYMNIVRASILNRENDYLKIILLCATIYVLLIHDVQIIFYTFGLLIILIFGYMLGHIMHLDKAQRQYVNYNFFSYIAFIITVSTVITFFAYDMIKWITAKLWFVYSYVMVLLGDIGIRLMEMGGFEFPETDIEQDINMFEGDTVKNPVEPIGDKSFMTGNVTTYIYVGLTMIIGAFICWYIYRLVKNHRVTQNQSEVDVVSFHTLTDDQVKKTSIFKRMLDRFINKPSHTVRKMVYDLERRAERTGQGRYPFETIKNWLSRFNIQANMSVYERVRYGDENVPDADIVAFKKELEAVVSSLHNQQKQKD